MTIVPFCSQVNKPQIECSIKSQIAFHFTESPKRSIKNGVHVLGSHFKESKELEVWINLPRPKRVLTGIF